jgi:hypothetical protein
MKLKNLIVLTSTAALFCACFPSVNPFYQESDLVLDNRLIGEWREINTNANEQPQVWKFEKSDDKGYKLLVTENDNKQGQFDAHLFKIKRECFLDIRPAEMTFATNQADLVAMCIYPGHLVFRIPQLEPRLKLAVFDFDWLGKYLDANPKSLACHKEKDGGILLTADTPALQKFLLKHLNDGLFKTPAEMERVAKTNSP